MVGRHIVPRQTLARVQRLQVRGEVIDPLRVQEAADDVGRLHVPDGGRVLRDGALEVVLLVQVVAVLAVDVEDEVVVVGGGVREVDGERVVGLAVPGGLVCNE